MPARVARPGAPAASGWTSRVIRGTNGTGSRLWSNLLREALLSDRWRRDDPSSRPTRTAPTDARSPLRVPDPPHDAVRECGRHPLARPGDRRQRRDLLAFRPDPASPPPGRRARRTGQPEASRADPGERLVQRGGVRRGDHLELPDGARPRAGADRARRDRRASHLRREHRLGRRADGWRRGVGDGRILLGARAASRARAAPAAERQRAGKRQPGGGDQPLLLDGSLPGEARRDRAVAPSQRARLHHRRRRAGRVRRDDARHAPC